MNKSQFKSVLTESVNHPKEIHGIFNWCDRWCERCGKTEYCTVYKTTSQLLSYNVDDFFKTLSMVFDATMDMIKEYAEKAGIDFESLKDTDFECEYDRKKYLIRNDDSVALATQYGNKVKQWLDALESKHPFGMEVRLQDVMLSDCLEVVQPLHHH